MFNGTTTLLQISYKQPKQRLPHPSDAPFYSRRGNARICQQHGSLPPPLLSALWGRKLPLTPDHRYPAAILGSRLTDSGGQKWANSKLYEAAMFILPQKCLEGMRMLDPLEGGTRSSLGKQPPQRTSLKFLLAQ